MDNTGIDSVDFDIEGSAKIGGNADDFFTQLHSNLSNENPPKQSTLTVEGSYSDQNVLNNFSQKFDGVNLMLYDNSGPSGLDATTVSGWIQRAGKDPSKVHIGFLGDGTYNGATGQQGGANAAQMYQQLCTTLGIKPSDLGQPFFWEDNPVAGSNPQGDAFVQQFNNTINNIPRTPWS